MLVFKSSTFLIHKTLFIVSFEGLGLNVPEGDLELDSSACSSQSGIAGVLHTPGLFEVGTEPEICVCQASTLPTERHFQSTFLEQSNRFLIWPMS